MINNDEINSQEKIIWVENKTSATVVLNTYPWTEGETLIVGYKDKGDVMIGLGIGEGVGPSFYRILIDKSVFVVTEVLEEVPDVSYYAFDQRYLVKEGRDLYFTRRYLDSETGEVTVEKIKVSDKCIISETSTGNIWVCDPPSLINFFDISGRASLEGVTDLGDGQVKIDLVSGGSIWKDLYFVSREEKQYLTGMIFDDNFKISMVGGRLTSGGSMTESKDPCVVTKTMYSLISKYSDKLVDLDETPEGWTREGLGSYTKIVPGNLTSSSGPVSGKLTISGHTGTKTLPSLTIPVDRYVFLIYSEEDVKVIEGADRVFLTSTPNLGPLTVTPPQDSYVWLAFPLSFKPTKITQLGVGYTLKDATKIISGVTKDGVVLGDYIVYRSLNPGNGKSQDINIE